MISNGIMLAFLVGLFLFWVNGISYLSTPTSSDTTQNNQKGCALSWPIPVLYSGIILSIIASSMVMPKSEILAIIVLIAGSAITIYVFVQFAFGSSSPKDKKKTDGSGGDQAELLMETDDRPETTT